MGLFLPVIHGKEGRFRFFIRDTVSLLPSFLIPGNGPLQPVSVVESVRLPLDAHAGPEAVLRIVMQVGGELVSLFRLVRLHRITKGEKAFLLQVLQGDATLGAPLFPLAGVELPGQ